MRAREAQFEDDILQLKRQATGAARSNIQENIDLMRLQREVKDKSTKLEALQAQYESLNSVRAEGQLLIICILHLVIVYFRHPSTPHHTQNNLTHHVAQ